jgi:hypothetical protein
VTPVVVVAPVLVVVARVVAVPAAVVVVGSTVDGGSACTCAAAGPASPTMTVPARAAATSRRLELTMPPASLTFIDG